MSWCLPRRPFLRLERSTRRYFRIGCLAAAFCPLGMGPSSTGNTVPEQQFYVNYIFVHPYSFAAYAIFYLAYVSSMICIRLWRGHRTFTTFYVLLRRS